MNHVLNLTTHMCITLRPKIIRTQSDQMTNKLHMVYMLLTPFIKFEIPQSS